MSTLSPPVVHVASITISVDSANGSKRLTSGELHVGHQQYKLICTEDGNLCQQFPAPITLSSEGQVTIRYRTSRLARKKAQTLDIQRLLASAQGSQELSLVQDGLIVKFVCQTPATVTTFHSPTPGVPPSMLQNADSLLPTTQSMLEDCPRFRILVIGKSGVGKSSLIKSAFGIEKAHSADLERGKADIEKGLVSPVNERFILHDSLGFEPGETENYETVKNFIRSKQTGLLKDQLHAVWFCIQTPYAGGRLLEAAAEDFFRSKHETMGAIPLVVVFTKFDSAVHDELMKRMAASSSNNRDSDSDRKDAYSSAESVVGRRCEEINQLTGDSKPLPFAVVSTKKNYEHTLQNLINMTHQEVGMGNTPEAQITSVVTLMAQRIDPNLKVRGSIDVGRKKYWRALGASPNFASHTIWDCLGVIHADIVSVWNFNDPSYYLLDNKFKELIIQLVQMLQMPSANPNRIAAMGGGSLVTAVSGFLGAISNPAAPIVLPIVAGLAMAVWAYDVYKNGKNVQQIFMTFIVDLTHVMETLFILTAGEHKKLTRRAIKLAYQSYRESNVMREAHARIQTYRDFDGRDAALETIESLIKPNESNDSNVQEYYAEIGKLNIQELNLDQEEDW